MRLEILVRCLVVAACAAGVVASLIAYRSVHRIDSAQADFVAGRSLSDVIALMRSSHSTLNPDSTRATGLAFALALDHRLGEAERTIRAATGREPENAFAWVIQTKVEVAAGDLRAARGSYARARVLDPELPATLPPGP